MDYIKKKFKNIKSVNNIWLILIIIFLLVSGIRIYYAFQTDYFSDNSAYFTLRQVEHISKTFIPLFNDPLSYGGRTFIFLPLFHYVLAFFTTTFSSIFIAKILPNIFASTIVFFTYLLVHEITKNKSVSILTSIISAFIPIYFSKTINSISIYSVIIPLTIFMLYLFIKIEEMKYTRYFLLIILLLLLTHPSIILLIASLLVYLALVTIENMKLKRSEIEVSLFSAFLMIWIYLLIFKKAFLKHGFNFIWENIPTKYFLTYFHQISIWQAIYQIGIIPFVLGIFIIYYYLFNLKNKKVYLIISFAITTTSLLWLKLIELEFALIFLGVILVILFGIGYNNLNNYLKQTRFSKLETPIFIVICIIFVLTSVLPSIILAKSVIAEATPPSYVESLKQIKDHTPETASIAASIDEGHLITYFAERKNLGDTNYLFLEDANEIVSDVDSLFYTVSTIKANQILHKYRVDYIMFTPEISEQYKIKKLMFLDNECFKEILNKQVSSENEIKLYKNKCVVMKSIIIN